MPLARTSAEIRRNSRWKSVKEVYTTSITKTMRPTEVLFRRIRRLALTTKQANKGFYKGTGTGSTGRHTKHGGYVIEWDKVRTYVVPPNLKSFNVSPIEWTKLPRYFVKL